MGMQTLRNTQKSKYKYVTICETDQKIKYRAQIKNWCKMCLDEREAAKAVDLKMIEQGKHPVNILVRK